jgi:hypothetical protein
MGKGLPGGRRKVGRMDYRTEPCSSGGARPVLGVKVSFLRCWLPADWVAAVRGRPRGRRARAGQLARPPRREQDAASSAGGTRPA